MIITVSFSINDSTIDVAIDDRKTLAELLTIFFSTCQKKGIKQEIFPKGFIGKDDITLQQKDLDKTINSLLFIFPFSKTAEVRIRAPQRTHRESIMDRRIASCNVSENSQ